MFVAATLMLLSAYDVPVEPPEGPLASLAWDQPVLCLQLQPTNMVPSGNFRVQCDPHRKRCLAAPTTVLIDGYESEEPLSRVHVGCSPEVDAMTRQALDEKWPFTLAVAETPDGWYRDDRGRVIQVNFDLGRRVYAGGAWAPYYRPDGTGSVGRARVEFGIVVNLIPNQGRVQHRLRFLESNVWLGATPRDVRFEGSVFRYEWGARMNRAPLWVSTFIGQPRRYDLPLNFGFGLEVLRIEYLPNATFVTIAEFDGALDIWRSKDLESFLRVRVGPAAEYDVAARGVGLRPTAALDGDFTLDADGFHHFTASVAAEKLFFTPLVAGRAASPSRLRIRAGYEVILFAINDYPLTLVVDGRATWRDDVVGLGGWEFVGNAGLRFSLWAPSRYSSKQTREELIPAPSVK